MVVDVQVDSLRAESETIAMYKQAMALAPNAAEKRRVLSGLSSVASVAALAMAAEHLSDKELLGESEAAVVRIAELIYKEHPQESESAVKKIMSSTKSDSVREQAEAVLNLIKGKGKVVEDTAS